MQLYLKKVLPRIEMAIESLMPRIASEAWSAKVANPRIPLDSQTVAAVCLRPFYELYDRGGKRIRPVLACLTHDALGGRHEGIYEFAAIPIPP